MRAFDRLLGVGGGVGSPSILGTPSILGDPTALVVEVDNPVKYIEDGFKAADRIHVGVGGGTGLAATIAAGASVTLTAQVANPFKPEFVTIQSAKAPGLFITEIDIAATRLLDGDPIPCEVFSEVSNYGRVSWPTVGTSQFIRITVVNRNAAAVTLVGFALQGIRLRK